MITATTDIAKRIKPFIYLSSARCAASCPEESTEVMQFDAAQQKRLEAFQITETDLAALRSAKEFATKRLPKLLEELHPRFAAFPEIQAALMDPEVHAARVAHWTRVACGEIGDGFMASAERLASIFFAHGVPGYAVAVCHATVSRAIIAELGLDRAAKGLRVLRGGNAAEKHALRDAINKAAWLDLEVLLETYADAERDSKRKTLRDMAETFEAKVRTVVDNVSRSSRSLEETVKSMSVTAARATEDAGMVAGAVHEASANVSVVAASAEQLELSIKEISGQVETSRTVAADAVTRSHETTRTMAALADAVGKIDSVINLISGIAGQTNLLALNATIEAARAGEAGKGFAVVAAEVKTLATQTAKATQDISEQILAIQGITQQAVGSITQIREIIDRISESSTAVSAAIEEQSASTNEIARNTQHAAAGNQQAADLMTGIRNGASETLNVASSLTGAAQDLGAQSDALRQAVDSFLADIRAA